jgi:hypothetical protein
MIDTIKIRIYGNNNKSNKSNKTNEKSTKTKASINKKSIND